MKAYVIVELFGGIIDNVHVYADEANARAHIDKSRAELGDQLDPECSKTSAISYDMEYETRMYEEEVKQ